jgi:addiction module HigA family antidote
MRIPAERPPTSPGEMLLEEFLKPLSMTQAELADRIGVSYVRLNEIINGRRGISPSTALRLAKALGTTPGFWMNSQIAVDLSFLVDGQPVGVRAPDQVILADGAIVEVLPPFAGG